MNSMVNNLKKIQVVVLLTLLVSACAYSPVPDGYTGPLSVIVDSSKVHTTSKADFFYLREIDGHYVSNARSETGRRNAGNGISMDVVSFQREVPSTMSSFMLVGRTAYGAPILAMTHAVYEVKGVVEFSPEANTKYVVKGELTPDYSVVWIENAESGEVVGDKIEINGSAELGFFDK